jgi:hypothetical protein
VPNAPPRILSSVDFPHPLSPSTPILAPRWNARVMFENKTRPPGRVFDRSCTVKIISPSIPAPARFVAAPLPDCVVLDAPARESTVAAGFGAELDAGFAFFLPPLCQRIATGMRSDATAVGVSTRSTASLEHARETRRNSISRHFYASTDCNSSTSIQLLIVQFDESSSGQASSSLPLHWQASATGSASGRLAIGGCSRQQLDPASVHWQCVGRQRHSSCTGTASMQHHCSVGEHYKSVSGNRIKRFGPHHHTSALTALKCQYCIHCRRILVLGNALTTHGVSTTSRLAPASEANMCVSGTLQGSESTGKA